MPEPLPRAVEDLVERLAAMPGVRAVALGGSRAAGEGDPHSDWDLGAYYRGTVDTSALASLGEVHPPGSWGRIMNGGAWLTVGGTRIDVLLRDLDAVEHWIARAEEGRFDVDGLLGYVAGCPTYSLAAEVALGRTLLGALPPVPRFPAALRAAAPPRWRFASAFSLEHARMRARRGELAGAVGQGARAAVERAHAALCARGTWVLNEKRILARAGLSSIDPLFGPGAPASADDAPAWVERLAAALGMERG
jgi:hypothetical protein